MKLGFATLTLIATFLLASDVRAFVTRSKTLPFPGSELFVASNVAPIDLSQVGAMTFRELQKHCASRGVDANGTTATLRKRLRDLCSERQEECLVDPFTMNVFGMENVFDTKGFDFTDESDPNFDFNEVVDDILEKAQIGHWKAATRKLKKLKRRYATPELPVPPEVYLATLQACMANRLQGARASEPARKILEDMADDGLAIPAEAANYCVQNCLGEGPQGTHDQCGGIDTALAMAAAVEASLDGRGKLTAETLGKLATTLASEKDLDEALSLLRSMVVDLSYTPPLQIFADIADAASKSDLEKVMSVLVFAKAAGYELDNIASTVDGRTILAAGVIAAEKMNNVALGLRLLTAAEKAEGCAPAKGDDLVASSSSAAQRACTLIHKQAINLACTDSDWRLSVKLLELMMSRSLSPSPNVWKNIVTCCAKAGKSKKATALLLDWVQLAEKGEIGKPPLSVFNSVVNVCEICEEQALTLLVLEAMKKTHEVDGNIITFNIALKRLAKQGAKQACEGIIIGMLQNGVEPTVVSYTTAIAAGASDPKDSSYAYEWLKRMRSRNVLPNVITYNTALATCLDGTFESTLLGSKIASEMLADVERQLEEGFSSNALTRVIPDKYTRSLARQLMKQLRENWRSGSINVQVAKATIRVPLLKLVDFEKSEASKVVQKQTEEVGQQKDDDEIEATERDEFELDYSTAATVAKRVAEV